VGRPADAEGQQHLRPARQVKAVFDPRPDSGVFQRLAVQAGEDPLAGGVQEQPFQGLAGAQPVRLAVTGREQNRCHRGGWTAGRQQAESAAEVEVALRQPSARADGRRRKRMRRHAIPRRAAGIAAPPPRLGPRSRIEVPLATSGGQVRQQFLADGPGTDP